MQIRRFSVCSRLALDSLCTICAFDFRPAVFCRIRAVCCCKIHIHSDVITSRIRYGKSNFSIGTVRISNMRVLCFSVRALFTLNALVSLFSLDSLQSLRSRISFVAFWSLELRPPVFCRIRAVFFCEIHVLSDISLIYAVRCRKACLSIRACCISDMQITGFTIRTVFSRGSIGAVLSVIALKFSPGVLGRICTVLQYIVHVGTDIFSCILPQLICCRVRNISISHMEETSQTILSGLSRNSLLSNNLYPGIDARVCKYRLFCRLIVCDTHVCLSS